MATGPPKSYTTNVCNDAIGWNLGISNGIAGIHNTNDTTIDGSCGHMTRIGAS